MRKIFTLFLGILITSIVIAQKPEGVVMKASVPPIVDGQIDDVWEEAEEYNIDKNFQQEIPSLGESGETTWKALWTDEGMFLLIQVTDDEYLPSWVSGGANSWEYDKPEIYFDVNYILEDGLGCQGNVNQGHYQFDIAMTEATVNGELTLINEEKNGLPFVYSNAFLVDDPNYVAEYFFPFLTFTTKEGSPIDISGQIGFDVTVIDRDTDDPARKRAVWANMGAINESWANMDDAGIITFDGAEPPTFVEEISISVDGNITEDNQKLQVNYEILPEDASTVLVKWILKTADGGTARAKISPLGVITPVVDEEIVVMATSLDDFVLSNQVNISISGQIPTIEELSWIKDGFFDDADENGKVSEVWSTGTNAVVTDGVLEFGPDEILANQWDYKLQQITYIPFDQKDKDYIISFQAWAEDPRTLPLVLEDTYADDAQYDAYFTSTHEYFDGGKQFNIPLTREAKVFKLDANFGPMKETTIQAFNFQVGLETPKIYIDSIIIISEEDMALIPPTSTKELSSADESFKVYPNPADTKLHIEFSTSSNKVAIYNSVGIKMTEEVVFGTQHTFDVSNYPKGLYLVKTENSVEKFVK